MTNLRYIIDDTTIKNGMKVIDDYNRNGVVVNCEDPHNVAISFRTFPLEFHCVVPECTAHKFSPIFCDD